MSFGFSLGDLNLAVKLGFQIYEKCFTQAERADVRYLRFGRDIQSLAESLQQLAEVTKHARDQRPKRRWGLKDDECRADLHALIEVTGDFSKTLEECQTLLGNSSKFRRNAANFIDNVLWHTSTESEVNNLRERVHLHITKLFFVIKPFEIQLLLGIQSELRKLRLDVLGLKGLLVTLHNQGAVACNPLHPQAGIKRIQIPEDAARRFLDAINNDMPKSFQDIADLPLKPGFDALVFHFAKSTVEFNPGVSPSQRVPEETQYLNLLKSEWILQKLRLSSHLSAAGPDSLWANYLMEVETDIMEEYRRFETGRLIAPFPDVIARLPDHCFSIWIAEVSSVRPSDLAEEKDLEDKILELTLPNPSAARELTIFRNSDIEFRMVVSTTVTNKLNKVVERESFPIHMQLTRFIPAYTIPEGTSAGVKSVNNVLLYRIQDRAYLWQSLKNADEVARFQQALLGYRVFDDVSNVRWSLNGSMKSCKHGVGRVQTWQVKRLSRISQCEALAITQNSSQTTESPRSGSTKEGLQRQSTGLSSTFYNSSMHTPIIGSRAKGIAIFPPEPPVLMIYTLCEEKYTFLHIELDTEIFVDEQACSCKNSPKSCIRIVLKIKGNKMRVRKYSAQEKHEKGLNSWDLAPFRLPRHPKYKEVEVLQKIKYICFDFASVPAKEKFCEELKILFKHVRDWEIEQYREEVSKHQKLSLSPGRR